MINVTDLILGIITLMTTGGGLASILSLISKKKIKKYILDIDKRQDKTIKNIKEDISYIKDILEDSQFLKKLKVNIYNSYSTITTLKTINNNEIKNAIFLGYINYEKLLEDIVHNEYNLSKEQIKNSAYHLLKNVKNNITREKLNLSENKSNIYLSDIENFLKNKVDYFIICYYKIKKYNNGKRRLFFKELAIKTFEEIIIYILEEYNYYYTIN